jgi:para-nitrobenzyl esterase
MMRLPKNAIAPTVPAYRPWWPLDQVEAVGVATAADLGCAPPADALSCLRATPAERLTTAENMQRFAFPAYGTNALPREPADALRQGDFHRVPVLQGSNRDENRLYVSAALAGGFTIDEATYDALLTDSFAAAAADVAATYPAAGFPSPALAWATVLTDSGWACTTLAADRALMARVPTYGYEFADREAPNFQAIPTVPEFPLGAAHGLELPYLFDFPGTNLRPDQRRLSELMIGYWTRFAHRSDPNGADAPHWPRMRAGNELILSLAPGQHGVRPINARAEHHCDLWDRINGSA